MALTPRRLLEFVDKFAAFLWFFFVELINESKLLANSRLTSLCIESSFFDVPVGVQWLIYCSINVLAQTKLAISCTAPYKHVVFFVKGS